MRSVTDRLPLRAQQAPSDSALPPLQSNTAKGWLEQALIICTFLIGAFLWLRGGDEVATVLAAATGVVLATTAAALVAVAGFAAARSLSAPRGGRAPA
jgi:hypothetical protein